MPRRAPPGAPADATGVRGARKRSERTVIRCVCVYVCSVCLCVEDVIYSVSIEFLQIDKCVRDVLFKRTCMSLLLSVRDSLPLQNPGCSSAFATTTPTSSHTNPTGHFVQPPSPPRTPSVGLPKNPLSQTHLVLPSPRVVVLMAQDTHRERFDSGWYLPCPQSVHCAYPSSLYFPGGHSPEHRAVVAPEVLL